MLFEVVEDRRDGWTVLSVIGELDLGAAPRMRQAVLRAVADADRSGGGEVGRAPGSGEVGRAPGSGGVGGPRLLLDLREVDVIDSSGLGIVMGALRRVRSAGGDLAVAVSAPARAVFEITHLDRILPLGDTLADAVAAADGMRDG